MNEIVAAGRVSRMAASEPRWEEVQEGLERAVAEATGVKAEGVAAYTAREL